MGEYAERLGEPQRSVPRVAHQPSAPAPAANVAPRGGQPSAASHDFSRIPVYPDGSPTIFIARTPEAGAGTLDAQQSQLAAPPPSGPGPQPRSAAPNQTWLQPLPSKIPPIHLPPAPAFAQLSEALGEPDTSTAPTATPTDVAMVTEANDYFGSTPLEPWEKAEGDYLDRRNKLVSMFEAKAYLVTRYILAESEKQALSENERYADESGADNEDANQLREAAAHLARVQDELLALANNSIFTEVTHSDQRAYVETLDDYLDHPLLLLPENQATGVPDDSVTPGSSEELYRNAPKEFPLAAERYRALREIYGQRFPILLPKNQDYSKIANAGPGGVGKYAHERSSEIFRNIQKVKKELSPSKIWSLPPIMQQTKQLLGIAEGTGANDAIEGHRADAALDAMFKKLALAALQIGLQIAAAALSGGTSLLVQGARAGLAVAGAAVTAHSVGEELDEFRFEKAASREVSLDPAKQLGVEAPGYFWLAFDIVGMVADIGMAASAFRSLTKPLQAANALGDVTKATRALATAEPVAGDLAKTTMSLSEVEEIVRAQAKVLGQDGKLAAGMTEDLFVERIMASLRRQVAAKGLIAEQRAGVLAKVIDGSHPHYAALVAGDRTALITLLTEHGEWKSLVMGLERGGQRQIAVNLMQRRQAVVQEIAAELKGAAVEKDAVHVGPMRGGSEEPISDIDLQIGGPEGGKLMVQAEESMARQYGENWSEMFRLNFYTEGERLTRYQDALSALKPAQKAAMTKRITQQTETFAFARMLQSAGDDPAALARVEGLAERMGVNLEQLRPLADVDEATKTLRRRELLLKVDRLEEEYRTATGARRVELAEEISATQMEANFYTYEANIGPGSLKISGVRGLEKQEAYQAALTQLDNIEHILAETGGDVARAGREYELFKYVARFGDVAEKAGIDTARLKYLRNQAEAVAGTQRELTEETAHLFQDPDRVRRAGMTDMPQSGASLPPVTDEFLQKQFDMFMHEAEEALGRLNSNAPRPGSLPRTRSNAVTAELEPVRAATVAAEGEVPKLINRSTAERYWMVDASNPRFSAEAHLEDGGELSLTFRMVDEGKHSAVLRGEEEFTEALLHFEGRVTGVRGAWSYGTNLAKFNKLTAAGNTLEEAALGTWTGEQAVKAGFTKVTVRSVEGQTGAYTKVNAFFYK